MTIHLLLLALLSQIFLVAGQLLLKHGMSYTKGATVLFGRVVCGVLAGVSMLTLWFFTWMGLLQQLDLSHVYPFEGISPVLLVVAATVILGERQSSRSWVGVGLIALGTVLVGIS
ncbi:MAG: hypothetical protein NTNFB02_28380 [Nitrospira sp.]